MLLWSGEGHGSSDTTLYGGHQGERRKEREGEEGCAVKSFGFASAQLCLLELQSSIDVNNSDKH